MSTKQEPKSVTQRIKDALFNGKSVTNEQVTKWGGSKNFLGKRVSEIRAQGTTVKLVNRRGVSAYVLAD